MRRSEHTQIHRGQYNRSLPSLKRVSMKEPTSVQNHAKASNCQIAEDTGPSGSGRVIAGESSIVDYGYQLVPGCIIRDVPSHL